MQSGTSTLPLPCETTALCFRFPLRNLKRLWPGPAWTGLAYRPPRGEALRADVIFAPV